VIKSGEWIWLVLQQAVWPTARTGFAPDCLERKSPYNVLPVIGRRYANAR
jgi:hypothetical protein